MRLFTEWRGFWDLRVEDLQRYVTSDETYGGREGITAGLESDSLWPRGGEDAGTTSSWATVQIHVHGSRREVSATVRSHEEFSRRTRQGTYGTGLCKCRIRVQIEWSRARTCRTLSRISVLLRSSRMFWGGVIWITSIPRWNSSKVPAVLYHAYVW